MALSLTLVALLALPSFAASQLVTTGSYFRNVKASETGETDSLIEEAFFNCDREKTCSSVVKSKTRGDVKTTRENLTTDQMEAYEFAYAKDTVIFHLQNIALGKRTTQSSNFSYHGVSFPSSYAVDGSLDLRQWDDEKNETYFKCSHTNSSSKGYWRVDFGGVAIVSQIKVYDRVECCAQRLGNFSIRIGYRDEAGGNPIYVRNRREAEPPGHFLAFTLKRLANGRYLFLESNLEGYLNICEVEVFGVVFD